MILCCILFSAVIKKVEDWISNGTFINNRFNVDWIDKQRSFFDSFLDVSFGISPMTTPSKRKSEVLVSSPLSFRSFVLFLFIKAFWHEWRLSRPKRRHLIFCIYLGISNFRKLSIQVIFQFLDWIFSNTCIHSSFKPSHSSRRSYEWISLKAVRLILLFRWCY